MDNTKDTPRYKKKADVIEIIDNLNAENASLKLELQKQKEEIQRFELERTEMYHKYEKQKELNAELVDTLKITKRELIEVNKKDMWEIEPTLFLIEDAIRNLESLIKKSSEI